MSEGFFPIVLIIGILLGLAVYLFLHRYGVFIGMQFLNFIGILIITYVILVLGSDKISLFVKKNWTKMRIRSKQSD